MAQGAADVGKGAAQGAMSLARGAAVGAANVAQGAAEVMKNTFGYSDNNPNNPPPSNPNPPSNAAATNPSNATKIWEEENKTFCLILFFNNFNVFKSLFFL